MGLFNHTLGPAISILLVSLTLQVSAREPYQLAFEPADLKAVDGDTMRAIAGPHKGERIRFRKFNAPELDEPGGPEAKQDLIDWISGHDGPIICTVYARDRWARIIAECY